MRSPLETNHGRRHADQTIVAPAIPIISNDFSALRDVGWYGSAYFATTTALQPLYGRLYRLSLKWPFVSCLVIFEIGSVVCAVAHNSKTFIAGRAIAGVGEFLPDSALSTLILCFSTLRERERGLHPHIRFSSHASGVAGSYIG